MFFSKKKVADNIQLLLYGQPMGTVSKYKYLGLWFNERYRWKDHVVNVETKCKKVLNLMRSISGYEWDADRQSIDAYL